MDGQRTKCVLVTGGAGFLGTHLCMRLLAEGRRVICVDDLSTGNENNLAAIAGHPHFELVQGDVAAPLDVDADEIYNLACPASPVHYQYDPIKTVVTNVQGARNVLELAERQGAKVLQASTSEVYGDPTVHPQPEGYWGHVNPTGPRACYDEGKRCAETLFFDYRRVHGVRIKVARIFNTYGPHMSVDDGRVVSNFIVQALTGRRLTIFGDGSQTRSFCYVDDLIEAFVRLMDSRDDFAGPVNLGNPTELTVAQLARAVLELTGSRSRLEFKPLPCDDPRQRRPDIALARAELDWEPTTPLQDGLLRTIEYFDALLCETGSKLPRPHADRLTRSVA